MQFKKLAHKQEMRMSRMEQSFSAKGDGPAAADNGAASAQMRQVEFQRSLMESREGLNPEFGSPSPVPTSEIHNKELSLKILIYLF